MLIDKGKSWLSYTEIACTEVEKIWKHLQKEAATPSIKMKYFRWFKADSEIGQQNKHSWEYKLWESSTKKKQISKARSK